MACVPCQAAAAAQAALNQGNNGPQQSIINQNCGMTRAILNNWYKMLACVKRNEYGERVNLAVVQMNQMLGVIQSALNYPDNYCYFYEQLEYFQTNVLQLIVNNVPECIEQ